jgi:G3E family GTPase
MAAPAMGERIPLSIVTGFLGSGKTTLIAALLRQAAMQATAVVVNEFGEVGIDDAIIAEVLDERDLLLLKNGCLCCTVGDDLGKTLFLLTKRATPPRRIVIETTGLADPVSLLQRLMADPRLRPAIRLDALIATIDAVNGLSTLSERPVAVRQAALADRRIITKTDLTQDVTDLSDQLRALNPGAGIWPVAHGKITADKLFGASLYNQATGEADVDHWLSLEAYRTDLERHLHGTHDGHHRGEPGVSSHLRSIGTWLVEEFHPVDWQKLSPRLGDIVARHGRSMLRLKGVLWTADDPRPLVIHGVQQLFHSPVRLRKWPREPRTSIVVIGERSAAYAAELIGRALADAVVREASDVAEAVAHPWP